MVSRGRHPAVAAGGRSLAARLPAKKWQHVRGQQLFHPSVMPWHVDRRCSLLLPHNRLSQYTNSWEGGGGLNCEAKAQVVIVTPSPLFFLEVQCVTVGRKKGGRNEGAVRYTHPPPPPPPPSPTHTHIKTKVRRRWQVHLY